MGDKTRGLYEKFTVIRNDGKSAPGQKHHGCQYFVLDCDHDPHARAALAAYAQSAKAEYPMLAADVRALLYGCAFGGIPTAELGRPDETSAADLFYILSLKHSKQSDDYMTLWRPNDAGYTIYLPAAGRYTRAEIEARPGYYNNGTGTAAVPCRIVDQHGVAAMYGYDCPGPVVPNDGALWTKLLEHRAAVSEGESL